MIYLDYSATTKTNKKVLKRFIKINKLFFNPNSDYKQAARVQKIINVTTNNIKQSLNTTNHDIIFTSGASEANNMIIKGLSDSLKNKHIITTKLEHASVVGPLGYLQKKGFKIDFVNLDKNGQVDLEHLKQLINPNTTLVTIAAVDSEIGIRQPIEKIAKLLKSYENVIFHTDITQCLGKDIIDLTNIDFASASGHKIYGFKGVGFILKRENLKIIPLIHGGKSTTIYRGGTPATELIDSLNTSLNILMPNIKNNYNYVQKLNAYLKQLLKNNNNIKINSTNKSLPHIVNISILNTDPLVIQKKLADSNILISTQTACSLNSNMSLAVLTITDDIKRAETSLRISLSYLTTRKEIKIFIKKLNFILGELNESN